MAALGALRNAAPRAPQQNLCLNNIPRWLIHVHFKVWSRWDLAGPKQRLGIKSYSNPRLSQRPYTQLPKSGQPCKVGCFCFIYKSPVYGVLHNFRTATETQNLPLPNKWPSWILKPETILFAMLGWSYNLVLIRAYHTDLECGLHIKIIQTALKSPMPRPHPDQFISEAFGWGPGVSGL